MMIAIDFKGQRLIHTGTTAKRLLTTLAGLTWGAFQYKLGTGDGKFYA